MNAPKQLLRIGITLLALAVVLSACFTGAPQIYQPNDQNAIYTAAAQTVVAQATLSAGQTAVAQLTQMAQGGIPSATPNGIPTATALPPTAMAAQPSLTPIFIPTATQIFIPPTRTQAPPPPPVWTPVPVSCDWAQFIDDVSYPDGTKVASGAGFTKIWLLRNVGSCTWTTAYGLVFVDGDRMQAKKYIPLYRNVRPGETIELGVDFVAPASAGRYRSYWMLSNQYGESFGIGPSARTAFWADVRVDASVSSDGFDFTAQVCNAVWRTNAGVLPCPGNPDSPSGSVVRLNDPWVETGKHENEPGLWTRPDSSRSGIITGAFPGYVVRNGDRFLADLGCIYKNRRCDVTFALDYKIANQAVTNLGTWHEVYEEQMVRANVDLSALAGKTVMFILRVENNGRWSDANALWFMPVIRGGGNPPPPPPPPPDDNLPAIAAARAKLAQDLSINPNRLSLVGYEPVYWPDSCLGLPQPGQVCNQVVVYGYRIIWSIDGVIYEAHTNEPGTIVYWVKLPS